MVSTADLRAVNRMNLEFASRELTEFFSAYAGSDPFEFRDALLEFFPEFVNVYGEQGAAVAAEYYDEMRSMSRTSGSFRAGIAEPVPVGQSAGSVRWAVGEVFADDWDSALQKLIGAGTRLIQQQGRDTIAWNVDRDPRAVGWRRETLSDSCLFCRMLAGRGGVYTKETAFFASHDNCRCVAAPSWRPDAKRVPVELYRLSASTSKMSESQLEVHRARVRDYLTTHKDELT